MKLLVGTDFSAPSIAALRYAVRLAKAVVGGATIHVAHAFEVPVLGVPDGTLGITPSIAARIVEDAERSMQMLVKNHNAEKTGIELTTSIEAGDPREQLLTVAEREGIDIIVVGTHGRQGIARALIGSIAEGIIRRSTRPVLTVHASLGDVSNAATYP